MFLLTFDIINSQKKTLKLAQLPKINEYLQHLQTQFTILDVQIHDGDQIRMITTVVTQVLPIILQVFSFLEKATFQARVFLTTGQITPVTEQILQTADGSLFHKNKVLETTVKADKNYYQRKENSIRYLGNSHTELLDLLFLSLTRLCLKSKNSSEILTLIFYAGAKQSEVGQTLGMTQVNVSKKLKNINSELFLTFVNQINLLLTKEEAINEKKFTK